MNSFTDTVLNEEYKRIQRLGDRLSELESLIGWESFRPILSDLYRSNGEFGEWPNTDVCLLLKLLVHQSFYGLLNQEMELQANDRISFRRFPGFPEKFPDHITFWYFQERLIETGKEKAVWDQLQAQLDVKGLKIKKGAIQDASFITSDPGMPLPIIREENRQRSGGAGMVLMQRKGRDPISATSSIYSSTGRTCSSGG